MWPLWAACFLTGISLAVRQESDGYTLDQEERLEQTSGNFSPALAYRARATDSELLILGSKHDVDFNSLSWRPVLEVELLRFKPSSAFENDNIMKISQAIDDLKEMDVRAEKILADQETTSSEEFRQQKQAWLDDLHSRQAIKDMSHAEGPMALKIGVTWWKAVRLVATYRQQSEAVLRGVDVTLWRQMKAADVEVKMLEDSAIANQHLSESIPDFENCGGEETAMKAFSAFEPAYVAGDVDGLSNATNIAVCVMGQSMALEMRNDAWVQKVLQHRPQKSLVVVGVAHLYDPDNKMSMLHVFAKNGYEVEPVELKPTLPTAQNTPEDVSQQITSLTLRGLRGIGGGIGIGI